MIEGRVNPPVVVAVVGKYKSARLKGTVCSSFFSVKRGAYDGRTPLDSDRMGCGCKRVLVAVAMMVCDTASLGAGLRRSVRGFSRSPGGSLMPLRGSSRHHWAWCLVCSLRCGAGSRPVPW